MKRLKSVGVISLANISAIIGLVLGFIIGLFYAFASCAVGTVADPAFGFGFGASLGFFAIIVTPLIYGAMGWIGGVIYAALYNLVAGWIGGVKIEIEEE